MGKNLKRSGKGLFAAAFVAVMGFGATQAFADVADTQPRDRCTDWCIARYNACLKYNWGNCIVEQSECLESCQIART